MCGGLVFFLFSCLVLMAFLSNRDLHLSILSILEELESQQLSYSYFNQLFKPCLSLLKQLTLGEDSNSYVLINTFKKDLNSCLLYFKRSLNDIREERGNHFGIFMPNKYRPELTNLVKFCEILSTSSSSTNPYAMMISNSESHFACLEIIQDISTRLFWLCSFGTQLSVSWDDFILAFIQSYDMKDMNLHLRHTFYQHLINSSSQSSSSQSNQNHTAVFDTPITVEMLNHFTMLSSHPMFLGLYQSFQYHCDPHTMIYYTGVIDDSSTEHLPVPTIMHSLLGHHIVQIACGGQHASVLTISGEIYSWGRGGFGRLGHGNAEPQPTPKLIQGLTHVHCKQVACGFAYSAAVDVNGRVYTWGAGENGRLGLGDTVDRLTPVMVTALKHISIDFVAAGSVHTCMKSQQGKIYSCGKFEYAGHGLPGDVLIPTVLECFADTPIKQISVGPGGYHTIALTFDNRVYSWGHNRVGQLGDPVKNEMFKNNEGAYFLPSPRSVPLPSLAKHFESIGQSDATILHPNVTQNEFDVDSTLQNLQSPVRIEQVMAGWGHSCLITTDGIGYVCGRNQHGQLGLGEQSQFLLNERKHYYLPIFTPMTTFPYLKNTASLTSYEYLTLVSCGGEHTIFKTNKNNIYSTGRGNCGQLGQNNRNDENLPKEIQYFKELSRNVLQIACGNSSSLFLVGQYCNPLSLFEQCLKVIDENEVSVLGCEEKETNTNSSSNDDNTQSKQQHQQQQNSKLTNPTIQFIKSLISTKQSV